MRGTILAALILIGAGPVYAQGAFDGTYRSKVGAVAGNSACGTTRFGYPVVVTGGTATMMTVSVGELEGKVGPDGSINIQKGAASLVGKINAGRFDGTYSNRACSFSLQYEKR